MGFHDGFEAGSEIDYYRIEAPVARSGMASIYRAVDLRDNRTVALKIPHPDLEADPILFDRFQRESSIGEKLNHPAVMRVFLSEKRSRLYMVMEWCEGRQLRLIIDENFLRATLFESPLAFSKRWSTFTPMELCIATSSRKTSWLMTRTI